MKKNIVVCGVGGQGTVLASKLLAQAAMDRGLIVKSAETIGMAQRGGSVFSHIRIGDGIASPLIAKGEADVVIAFEPAEAVRVLPYLKKDGCLITSDHPVLPVTATLGGAPYEAEAMLKYLKQQVSDLHIIETEKALHEIGSTKVLNLLLLGAAAQTGSIGLDRQDLRRAVEEIVAPRFHQLNFSALDYFAKEEPA